MRLGGGGVISPNDPWTNVDGRLNAPLGAPQHPNLLNGYPTATPPNCRIRFPRTGGTQPPWMVAGVDYAVGINSGITLQDPVPGGSLAAALVAIGGSTGGAPVDTIFFSGTTNATISGWDFSLHNGVRVEFQSSCSNVIFQNNNLKTGSNNFRPLFIDDTCSNFTVQYNVIDGGGSQTTGFAESNTAGVMDVNCYNGFKVYYNWFKHAPAEGMVIATSPNGQVSLDLRFNVIEDCGTAAGKTIFTGSVSGTTLTVTSFDSSTPGGPILVGTTITGTGVTANSVVQAYGTAGTSGTGGTGTYSLTASSSSTGSEQLVSSFNSGAVHGDMIQSYSATGHQDFINWRGDFNLWLQTQTFAIAAAQGLSVFTANVGSQAQPSVVRAISQQNNVLIATAPTKMSPMLMVDPAWLNGLAIVSNNYVDPSGCYSNPIADLNFSNGASDGPNGNNAITGTVTGLSSPVSWGTNMVDGTAIP